MRVAIFLALLQMTLPMRAVAQVGPIQSGPGPDTLAALVAELERHNPDLQAARREVDMRLARIPAAGAPPDPRLTFGYMGGLLRPFFPSSRVAGSFQQLGASQEIPYPGKLALQTGIAVSEADAERWNFETGRRQLAASLKTAYFEYVYVDRSIAIVRRNKELLEEVARIAEVQFAVGKGLQQDVLKAQLEISMLIERLEMLEREHRTLLARLNGLLSRDPSSNLSPSLAFDVADTVPPLDELERRVEASHPGLKRDERLIDRGQQALSLARKEALPDFEVSVTTQRFTNDMPWMYGVDVMVKVPIYWQRKQRPLVAEAAAALESSRQMRESTLTMAQADAAAEHADLTTSQRLVALFDDSILPQARLALESSVAAYQVGSVDFLTLLSNFITVLNYEVNYEEQQARYWQALARLEPLVGLELVK